MSISRRAAVVGAGIAGLTTAWDLATAGVDVTVYEAADRPGGALAPVTLAGIEVDAGAEAFATRTDAVAGLIAELGLEGQIISPSPAAAWLQLPDLAAPLPATGILGIPADPTADDVVAILGPSAAARAAEDLHRPVAEWQQAEIPTLGAVVRDRMGTAVLERLVSPITSGVHSAHPDDLDMDTAAPGLFAAMLRTGSLAQAVAEQKAAAPAGSAVRSLRGGMHTLVTTLTAALREAGVPLRLGSPVTDLTGLDADDVVVAVDGPSALDLLSTAVRLPDPAAVARQRGVALVSMLVRAEELDDAPRGTGMLVAPGVSGVDAKAMTHVSAKWDWVAEALRDRFGPGHHVVRLSYGRVSDEPGSGALGFHSADEDLVTAAAADLPALTGAAIAAEQVLAARTARWERSLGAGTTGHRRRTEEIRAVLAERTGTTAPGTAGAAGPRLWATGAWFAGTGLARVIPDARRTAAEILAR